MWTSTGCSTTLFLVAYIIIEVRPASRPANIIKFVLWAMALLVEAGSYFLTPMHRAISARLMTNPMNERFCTLTVLTIGEGMFRRANFKFISRSQLMTAGLNSAGSTIVSAARAVGYDARTGAQIFKFSLGFVYLNYETCIADRMLLTGSLS